VNDITEIMMNDLSQFDSIEDKLAYLRAVEDKVNELMAGIDSEKAN
jgi:hypothetical protein